jgi:hypothetical protein
LLSFSPGAAAASTTERLGFHELLDQADLVFEGTVVSIEFKNSEVVEAGDAKLPHTFVTYAIEDRVKGDSSAGQFVTLRFLGGPAGDGRVLEVAGVPQFALGDRDVLFVRNEKSMIGPIVGLEAGRYRVVRGGVFDALGNNLWFTPEGQAIAEPNGVDLSKPGYPNVANSEAHDGAAFEVPAGSVRPDVAGLKALLRLQIALSAATAAPKEPRTFTSARISDVLRFPRLRAVAPKVLPREPIAKRADRANAEDDDR